jgi:hypothetical protein
MDRHDIFELTAPCGLDCFNCELLEANLTAERRAAFAVRFGRAASEVGCKGCRVEGGCKMLETPCPTRACVTSRELSFCSQCDDFPCARLMPARDGADRYPHNVKLYNLCRIQSAGLQRWAEEEAAQVRERYFHGRFRPGHGPSLEN